MSPRVILIGFFAISLCSTNLGRAQNAPRPNALAGKEACSMMNETNYMQVGRTPGGDVQLKVLCAHAYHYYTLYKKAMSEGYSEADYMRTYDAHAKSALVVVDWFTNHRSDDGDAFLKLDAAVDNSRKQRAIDAKLQEAQDSRSKSKNPAKPSKGPRCPKTAYTCEQ